METCNVKVGMAATFYPFADIGTSYGGTELRGKRVTGKVVYVNRAGQWFSVEYGNSQRMSFKFQDIGKGKDKRVVLS